MNETKQEKPEGIARRLVRAIRKMGYVSFDDVIALARQNGRHFRESTITRKLRADKHLTSEQLKRDLACIKPVMNDGNSIKGYRYIEKQEEIKNKWTNKY